MPKGSKQVKATNKGLVEQKEAATQRAIKLYESGADSSPGTRPGYRTACRMAEDEIEQETGVKVELCHNTVRARLKGAFRTC